MKMDDTGQLTIVPKPTIFFKGFGGGPLLFTTIWGHT